jgi:hypothetical protein
MVAPICCVAPNIAVQHKIYLILKAAGMARNLHRRKQEPNRPARARCRMAPEHRWLELGAQHADPGARRRVGSSDHGKRAPLQARPPYPTRRRPRGRRGTDRARPSHRRNAADGDAVPPISADPRRDVRWVTACKMARHLGLVALSRAAADVEAKGVRTDRTGKESPAMIGQLSAIALLFGMIFGLNLIPACAPPTWMALAFVGFQFPETNPLLLAPVGAVAATLGRLALAKLSHWILRECSRIAAPKLQPRPNSLLSRLAESLTSFLLPMAPCALTRRDDVGTLKVRKGSRAAEAARPGLPLHLMDSRRQQRP